MQLKRILLHGFKSFARKTEFCFDSMVTAIVGPNGSGKSNIVDAIRWALGEQSPRTLRGNRMTDIIFSGSDTVKGQTEASVLLELTGEEFSGKTTIKRTVDREGQGRYYIDGRPCRMKDIKNLFLDSGVGSSGYALVGQGEVEGILLASPFQRRRMFDDVAGIAGIRAHKEEAEEGLLETQKDLQRIQDIIQELKKREAPLKEEAQKAQEVSRLKRALREKELDLLLHQLEKEERILGELNSLQTKLTEDLERERRARKLAEKQRQKMQEEIEEGQDGLASAQDDRLMYNTRLQEITSLLGVNQEKLKYLTANREDMKKRREEVKARLHLLQEKEMEIQDALLNLSQVMNQHQEKGIEREKSLAHIQAEEEALKKRQAQLENLHLQDREHHFALTQRLERLIQEEKAYQKKEINLKNRMQLEEEEERRKEEKIKEKKRTHSHHKDEYQRLQGEMIELRRRRGDMEEKKAALSSTIQKRAQEREGVSTRLQLLKEMEEDFRGFFPGVRSLLQAQKNSHSWGPGIVGVVAHLVDFQPCLREAMAAALGARDQNVVVYHQREARLAVDYLRQNSLGRVTFLPLDTITPYSFQQQEEEQLSGKGILGPLVNHISFHEQVAPAILHLLGRVVLVEDLKRASPLARRFNQRLKMVTLTGELLLPGGAITGGSLQEKKGILLRRGEMQELKEGLSALNLKQEQAEQEKGQLEDAVLSLAQEEEEKKDLLHQTELQLTTLNEEILYGEREIKQRKEYQLDLFQEMEIYQERLQVLQEELKTLTHKSQRREDTQGGTEDYLVQLEENRKEQALLKEKEKTLTKSLTSLQVELATWEEEKRGKGEQRLAVEEEKGALLQEEKNLQGELLFSEEKETALQEKQDSLKKDREECQRELADLEGRIGRLKEKLERELDQLKRQEDYLRSRYHQVEDLQSRERSLNVKVTRSQMQLESILEQLMDYGVQKGTRPTVVMENLHQEHQQVKRMKRELERQGSVNPGSIHEYREVTERLSFLKEQSQDLLEARKAMEQVIHQIEEGMKERFLDTFHAVNGAFQEIFSQLFQGGSARLGLSDGSDPLGSGIEIMAQPPGKKLQQLSLMSGGEKALTAIALIFAFLKVTPSPFYILDEIDSSLDEANLRRFSRFMSSFDETQFILITHRRSSMAVADTLYGLTMGDGAVSQLVTVSLKDREDKVV